MSANGVVSLGGRLENDEVNLDLRASTPAFRVVAPLWMDLTLQPSETGADSAVYFKRVDGTDTPSQLIIQWTNVGYDDGERISLVTFQVALWEDGRIRFNYQDLLRDGASGRPPLATAGIAGNGSSAEPPLQVAYEEHNRFVGTQQSFMLGTFPDPRVDMYRFALEAGESVTLAASSLTNAFTLAGNVNLWLHDPFERRWKRAALLCRAHGWDIHDLGAGPSR